MSGTVTEIVVEIAQPCQLCGKPTQLAVDSVAKRSGRVTRRFVCSKCSEVVSSDELQTRTKRLEDGTTVMFCNHHNKWEWDCQTCGHVNGMRDVSCSDCGHDRKGQVR